MVRAFTLGFILKVNSLTAVAQWCQVLSGSVDIDYLLCSKLSLQAQKNMSAAMASREFLSCSNCVSPTHTQMQSFRCEGKPSALLGRHVVRFGVIISSLSIQILVKSFTGFCFYIIVVH